MSAIKASGRIASDIDPYAYNWRFLLYNHKFDEYCDTNMKDKRNVIDGDKFQLVFVPKNGQPPRLQRSEWIPTEQHQFGKNQRPSAIAEIQEQTPLVFLDDDDVEEMDVKPVSRNKYRDPLEFSHSTCLFEPTLQICSRQST